MSERKPRRYFMEHPQMDFEIQVILGGCHYGAADAGEVLATAGGIQSGDFEGWYRGWRRTAERLEKTAATSLSLGRRVSARRTFLRAASYFSASAIFIDGTDDPARGGEAWQRHLACWDRFCSLLDPPAEKVFIPYEETPLPGWFFTPAGGGRRATVIFNNGSDGPTCSMWSCGVAGALERGYSALVFDGPGQNSMLWRHDIPFRPDWEKVITPVVDFLRARDDVDPERIALSGISQGGYWILRALAFERRIAAGIADPGVMDVSTAFFRQLPPEMIGLFDSGEEESFNAAMEEGLRQMGPLVRQNMEWRMKPYGIKSYYGLFRAVREYNLREVIGKIRCPVFISDPEDEQFWPGQSREVYQGLTCPKTIVPFTAAEGANWHCQPQARGLYDQRMFDWLDSIISE